MEGKGGIVSFFIMVVFTILALGIGLLYSLSKSAIDGRHQMLAPSSTPPGTSTSVALNFPAIDPGYVEYESRTLGIGFSYPRYLGPIEEATTSDVNLNVQDFITFSSSTNYDTGMNVWPVNTSTDFAVPSAENIFGYTGGPIDRACSQNGYFDTTDYAIQLTYCDITTNSNGVVLAEFGGTYSPLASVRGETEPYQFEGAFLQTRSLVWPGIIIDVDQEYDYQNYVRDAEQLKDTIDSVYYETL